MSEHFEPMSIEHALKNNLLPQPCCPKTYFVQNDNEMDEEFEEECPACKEAGYLTKEYLEKLEKECDELKRMHEINKSVEQLTISSDSSNESISVKDISNEEPFSEMISDVISGFMSSFFKPMFDKEHESEETEETEEPVKSKLVKSKLVKSKLVKSKLVKSKPYKLRKYGFKKYKLKKLIQ
jgi:hypothetical protein